MVEHHIQILAETAPSTTARTENKTHVCRPTSEQNHHACQTLSRTRNFHDQSLLQRHKPTLLALFWSIEKEEKNMQPPYNI